MRKTVSVPLVVLVGWLLLTVTAIPVSYSRGSLRGFIEAHRETERALTVAADWHRIAEDAQHVAAQWESNSKEFERAAMSFERTASGCLADLRRVVR